MVAGGQALASFGAVMVFRSSRRGFVRAVAGATVGATGLLAKGPAPSAIVLSNEASPSERWAAEELRRHVEKMTGVVLPILPIETGAGVAGSRRVIAVGQSALTDQLGVEAATGESCRIKTVGETLVIAGGRQRGTMYGVFIFLERLGCRWFTADVARVPRMENLRLPEFDEVHRPGFEYREVFFTEAQGKEWSARNRLNGHFHKLDEGVGGRVVYMPFAHAYYDMVPPDRYFESHPEYFALVLGRRRREYAQLCLTNADVLRLAVEQAERWLAENPEVAIVSMSQNDGGGWCECGPCREVINEEGGAASGLALRFVNQVAERLAVSHPGKTVDMLAYQQTADAPAKARPLPNVQIRFCPIEACQAHSLTGTCEYNQRFRERLAKWSKIAPKLHIWQYSVNFSHFLAPFPNYDALLADIPKFRRAGVSGMFIEGAVSEGGGGDDAELRSYLAARLVWNPELDARAEIREFLGAVYGPAAPLMRSYFELRQHEVRRGQHLWMDQNVDAGYLTPAFLRQGRALLEKAARTSGAARKRIERHLLSLDYVEAVREKRCVIHGEAYGPVDAERVRSDTQKMVSAAEALGVTNLREGYPLAQQVRDWGDPAYSYKVSALQDGTLIAPELARVIAFRRDNVLRMPDPGELAYPNDGGIYVQLSSGYLTWPLAVTWTLQTAERNAVTLAGTSEAKHEVTLRYALEGGALQVRVTVRNRSDEVRRVAMTVRAEFDGRKLGLHEQSASGNRTLAGPEWTLGGVGGSFSAEEVARCSYSWLFRGAGLNVTVSVVSPEAELAPGQQMQISCDLR